MLMDKSTAYGWVFVWALWGIWYKHTASWGFNGQYRGVVIATITCIGLWLMANGYVLLKQKQEVSLWVKDKR
jgi:hypothetical protein